VSRQQHGGSPAATPSSSPAAIVGASSSLRTIKFVDHNRPYPLEGAPAFPPGFLTDGSCAIL
jgi:hypothetical protein